MCFRGPWLFDPGLPGGGWPLSGAAAQHLGFKDLARHSGDGCWMWLDSLLDARALPDLPGAWSEDSKERGDLRGDRRKFLGDMRKFLPHAVQEWIRFPDVHRHVFRREHKSAGMGQWTVTGALNVQSDDLYRLEKCWEDISTHEKPDRLHFAVAL